MFGRLMYLHTMETSYRTSPEIKELDRQLTSLFQFSELFPKLSGNINWYQAL